MGKTIVIKVGTSTLTRGGVGLSKPNMLELVRQIATLHQEGHRVMLVSSGAQAAGRDVLGHPNLPPALQVKQMLCAVGQGHLMRVYSDLFGLYNVRVGQVLVTKEDLQNRRTRYLNVRDTLEMLLEYQLVPIINENDTVAVDEIKVGDNDNISALIASLINADILVILTDQNGLFDKDPRQHPDAKLIHIVPQIDDRIRALAGKSSSGLGIGGMQTKLQAAEVAGRSGIETIIVNGSAKDSLLRVIAGEEIGTRFLPSAPRVESRKRWLLSEPPQGTLTIDDGAVKVLQTGRASLLPVGIKQIDGHFTRGSLVAIKDLHGNRLAHGLTNYDSIELTKLCGIKSELIEAALGYTYGAEAVHRDNMALIKVGEMQHG